MKRLIIVVILFIFFTASNAQIKDYLDIGLDTKAHTQKVLKDNKYFPDLGISASLIFPRIKQVSRGSSEMFANLDFLMVRPPNNSEDKKIFPRMWMEIGVSVYIARLETQWPGLNWSYLVEQHIFNSYLEGSGQLFFPITQKAFAHTLNYLWKGQLFNRPLRYGFGYDLMRRVENEFFRFGPRLQWILVPANNSKDLIIIGTDLLFQINPRQFILNISFTFESFLDNK